MKTIAHDIMKKIHNTMRLCQHIMLVDWGLRSHQQLRSYGDWSSVYKASDIYNTNVEVYNANCATYNHLSRI